MGVNLSIKSQILIFEKYLEVTKNKRFDDWISDILRYYCLLEFIFKKRIELGIYISTQGNVIEIQVLKNSSWQRKRTLSLKRKPRKWDKQLLSQQS